MSIVNRRAGSHHNPMPPDGLDTQPIRMDTYQISPGDSRYLQPRRSQQLSHRVAGRTYSPPHSSGIRIFKAPARLWAGILADPQDAVEPTNQSSPSGHCGRELGIFPNLSNRCSYRSWSFRSHPVPRGLDPSPSEPPFLGRSPPHDPSQFTAPRPRHDLRASGVSQPKPGVSYHNPIPRPEG